MTKRIAPALLALATLALAPVFADASGLDRRLVGTYRHTSAYTSGTFTAVHEQILVLAADGTASIAANAAGGTSSASIGKAARRTVTHEGTWSVEGRTLILRWKRQGVERLPFLYGQTGGTWKLALGRAGSRKLWYKLR